MQDSKPVKVPIPVGVNLSVEQVSQDTRRGRGHVPCSICKCSW
jgi:hypothetical protein